MPAHARRRHRLSPEEELARHISGMNDSLNLINKSGQDLTPFTDAVSAAKAYVLEKNPNFFDEPE